MMTSTLITLIGIIVILFGGTVLVMLKAMGKKNFGDEEEPGAEEAERKPDTTV